MAQSDYGAAAPLLAIPQSIGRFYDRYNQPMRNPFRKPDTSWHDMMVRKANEGFRERAAREQAAREKASKRKAGARKSTDRSVRKNRRQASSRASRSTTTRKATR